MNKFNPNIGGSGNPTVGSGVYFWRIKMATDPSLIDNIFNDHNREWWDNERKRIEGIRASKPHLVRE